MSGPQEDPKTKQFVNNVVRRTWDEEVYKKMAKDRISRLDNEEQEDQELKRKSAPLPTGHRAFLKTRDYSLDLENKLGKTQVVSANLPAAQQAGFYCKVCDCTVKDHVNYVDHINGKKHQRALGMQMTVERASADGVRSMFAKLKSKTLTPEERRREQEEKERQLRREQAKIANEKAIAEAEAESEVSSKTVKDREDEAQDEEDKTKQKKKEESEEEPKEEERNDEEAAMAAMMGIPLDFSLSKKKQ